VDVRHSSVAGGGAPDWCIDACALEKSADEAATWLAWWRSLSQPQRVLASAEKAWSLADWIHRMKPDEREWWWWDGSVADSRSLRIELQVSGWPFPTGALGWLLRCAGASSIDFP
jgi:hypothetical protein